MRYNGEKVRADAKILGRRSGRRPQPGPSRRPAAEWLPRDRRQWQAHRRKPPGRRRDRHHASPPVCSGAWGDGAPQPAQGSGSGDRAAPTVRLAVGARRPVALRRAHPTPDDPYPAAGPTRSTSRLRPAMPRWLPAVGSAYRHASDQNAAIQQLRLTRTDPRQCTQRQLHTPHEHPRRFQLDGPVAPVYDAALRPVLDAREEVIRRASEAEDDAYVIALRRAARTCRSRAGCSADEPPPNKGAGDARPQDSSSAAQAHRRFLRRHTDLFRCVSSSRSPQQEWIPRPRLPTHAEPPPLGPQPSTPFRTPPPPPRGARLSTAGSSFQRCPPTHGTQGGDPSVQEKHHPGFVPHQAGSRTTLPPRAAVQPSGAKGRRLRSTAALRGSPRGERSRRQWTFGKQRARSNTPEYELKDDLAPRASGGSDVEYLGIS